MKNAAMPKSRAKTAYGLLSEIRRIILAEPKRYNQHNTLLQGREVADCVLESERPACGTIGCVAGWVTALRSPRSRNPIDAAIRVLGLDDQQGEELIDSFAAGRRDDMEAHAIRGAAHIARFQKNHAKQLKAKRLK